MESIEARNIPELLRFLGRWVLDGRQIKKVRGCWGFPLGGPGIDIDVDNRPKFKEPFLLRFLMAFFSFSQSIVDI
jgi:hypothetical protein